MALLERAMKTKKRGNIIRKEEAMTEITIQKQKYGLSACLYGWIFV